MASGNKNVYLLMHLIPSHPLLACSDGDKTYLSQAIRLTDQQYGVNRVVTSLEWSPHVSQQAIEMVGCLRTILIYL